MSEASATILVEISLAIGKGGQNRQLASILTGYEITTVKESEWVALESKEEKLLLVDIPELSKTIVQKLVDAGYETADEVLDAGKEALCELKGLGEKKAGKIIDILNSYYEMEPQGKKSESFDSAESPIAVDGE